SLSLFGYCIEFPTPRTNSWRESFDCCSWEGVTCDKVIGHVVFWFHFILLEFENHDFNMLSSNLTSLRDLHHDSVNISSIPGEIFLLPPLNFGITDSFPVSNWSSPLNSLVLGNYGFKGSLPGSLANFTLLTSLDISRNLNKLTTLQFDACNFSEDPLQDHTSGLQISGGLPFWLFTLPSLYFFELEKLSYLDLSSNNLSGTVESNTLAKLEKLGYLELSNNRFLSLSGSDSDINYTIPMLTSFLFFSLLVMQERPLLVPPPLVHVLDLSRNSLGKTIPECLGNLNRFLMFLQLHMNNFHGLVTRRLVQKFQREMEMMQLLSIFIAMDFSENLFYGHIPKELGALCSLQVLNLSHNHFNGPIPPSYSRIYQN
ncbi:hypothetical protein ES332_D03G197300v1, partial [Gossypium tomentosum]